MQTQADWYRDECEGVISPRIPNYNYTAPGFHELVARQPPLTQDDEILIDDLARRRCQCLMSVDDAHAAIVQATKDLGVYENTYFLVSSDHVRSHPISLPSCACAREDSVENLLKALAPFTFSPAAGETCESLTTAWVMATLRRVTT